MTTTKNLQEIKKSYYAAVAERDRQNEIITSCCEKILQENIFISEDTGKRITNEYYVYEMSDTENNRYWQLVGQEKLKHELNNNSYAITEKINKLENQLIDYALNFLPIPERTILNKNRNIVVYRDKMLALALQLN